MINDIEWMDHPEVQLIKHNVSDTDVARAAWVSTVGSDSIKKDSEKESGLIKFLMRDKHGSPFEHGSMTFFIKTPLFVRSEFHRHRIGWSYNEESGRYSVLKPHFYLIDSNRKLIQHGKPGEYKFSLSDKSLIEETQNKIKKNSINSWSSYKELIESGVAKEVARMVLPLNIFTSFYATCNPRSLMSFLSLRTENDLATFKSHPQYEIQQVANELEHHFSILMPKTYLAWNDSGRVSP